MSESAGTNAVATLYYGPVDCLTFVKRDLHGTEKKGLSREMLADGRTWASATKAQSAKDGQNLFSLSELQPDQKYFYRIFISNMDGKSWDYESGHFRTVK